MPSPLDTLAATQGRIVVLSPHLDDAVLSLGASIAYVARRGADVDVVTVLAGDPTFSAPAGRYDRSCGFTTAGEAAGARQEEDAKACKLIGARPIWLPFWDGYYPGGADKETIVQAIEAALPDTGLLLIPGFPLLHPDHIWLTKLVLTDLASSIPLGLYMEQPYAMSGFFGSKVPASARVRGVISGLRARQKKRLTIETPTSLTRLMGNVEGWVGLRASPGDWVAKQRAIGTYRSQLPKLGLLVRTRLGIFEWCWGGEAFAPLPEDVWLTKSRLQREPAQKGHRSSP